MEDQEILILDEPMNGLDKEGVAEMRKFFSPFIAILPESTRRKPQIHLNNTVFPEPL